VKDFWENPHNVGKWRIWKKIEDREDRTLNSKVKSLKRMLDQRIILVMEGQDQLRWGNNKEGNFNIKEAKGFLLDQEPQAANKTWQKLWRHKGWMKSKLFMWLVHHRKILTWDNLKKGACWDPPDVISVRPMRRLSSIFSTVVYSLIGYGIFLPISSNSLTETKKVLLTLLTIGGIIFLIMKFSIQPGISFQA